MAQYRVTFQDKVTGTRQDIYLSSADARTVKKADIKAANMKAIAKAKTMAPKKLFAFVKLSDFAVVDVLCVG